MSRMLRKIKDWFTVDQSDTDVEAERGRRESRGGVERYTKYLWDTPSKLRSMEGLLRKRSREEENERVQGRAEKALARTSGLRRIYKDKDFQYEIEELQTIERSCYWSLRHPESRKDSISFEFFNGYINGQLSIIEHLRTMYERAESEAKRTEEAARRERELAEGK